MIETIVIDQHPAVEISLTNNDFEIETMLFVFHGFNIVQIFQMAKSPESNKPMELLSADIEYWLIPILNPSYIKIPYTGLTVTYIKR